MEILVLGCSGVFLRRVLPALNNCVEITKIHVASKSKSRAELDESVSYKIGFWFTTYLEAINASCADVVYLSLPNHLHFMWAKKSLEAGLHVIVEKPVTLKLSDTQCLVALSVKKSLCLAEATVWQFHPNIDLLKDKLVSFQKEPLLISGTFTVPTFNDDNFRNFPEFGGGAFNDMSAYAVSIGRVLFEEIPSCVSGEIISYDDSSNINTGFSVTMEFTENRVIQGLFGFDLDYRNTLKIAGNGFEYELDRVFSPPPNVAINIKTKINKESTDEFCKGDPYLRFFKEILGTYNTKDRVQWSARILQDAELTNRLKLVITP